MNRLLSFLLVADFLLSVSCSQPRQNFPDPSNPLYRYSGHLKPRWSSPENLNGKLGAGAKENDGAKGHAFDPIKAGETRVLLDVQGTGMISRLWITVIDRTPEMLRSLKIEMFWDNEKRPAVSAPLGDFFGVGLGRTARFYNALFANPEGRSFACFIPMPYKTGARITVTNESGKDLSHIFFDVDFQEMDQWDETNLYFHTYWSRDTATALGRDFELLPRVTGRGRFVGVNVGIQANPRYRDAWWGEGEVKMYLDADQDFPTLAGTGTEDYIGTGWGQGEFFNDYAGCLIADQKNFAWTFYRYHIPDPIFFESACRVALQMIGGNMKSEVLKLQKENVPLIPVTVDSGGKLTMLYRKDSVVSLDRPDIPDGWTNFYRSDDVSATAYFYLDKPSSNLPEIVPAALRSFQR